MRITTHGFQKQIIYQRARKKRRMSWRAQQLWNRSGIYFSLSGIHERKEPLNKQDARAKIHLLNLFKINGQHFYQKAYQKLA